MIDRYLQLDTTAISDALESLGLPGGVAGPLPQTVDVTLVGFARTVLLEAIVDPDASTEAGSHILGEAVDTAAVGDVMVIDNLGRSDVSCWGGLLSLGSVLRGVRGVLANGAVRDVSEIRRLGFPVYATGTVPATARGRLRQRSVGEPVTVWGRTVAAGDLVMVDRTGLVVVPRSRAAEVLDVAAGFCEREKSIAADISSGIGLTRAMHDARLAGDAER
ncbi:RraA family protein [Curtobacterium flaccumfaciens pv. oortii]|uniref:RraA family protein n=1 Tax=Curtobacterium flaccumfaciens TaxID=2035 RepID=UPI002659B38B|nr:RraA family protein [Curtobacterium flaccumfaciens]MCS5524646.1 RraA family protein [Curtobacterium flaccumfaciens pv. oortii]